MKIICIGRNYVDHISELNNEKPTEPVIFLKPDTAVLPKKTPFVIPAFSNDVHHEVEVLVKICKVGKYIDAKFAHKYYDEIGLGIDFTARDVQAQLKEKGLDTLAQPVSSHKSSPERIEAALQSLREED